LSDSELPAKSDSLLVSRTNFGPVSREWTANEDEAGHHHGLIDLNEVPCYLALYWQSKRAGRTVHVGTYKLNLRRLISGGYARAEGKRNARLRFVRDDDGVVSIQINDSGPALAVGEAHFD
jgi:hypothetical protein